MDNNWKRIHALVDEIGVKAAIAKLECHSPSNAAACSADGEAALGEAMQDVWNDRCQDIGEMPTCFEVRGPKTTRVVADFEGSAFVRDIVETLKARGYSILPNAKTLP